MKYSGNINYIKCLEFGLNLSQGAVMDMMMNLSTWAEGKEINGEIYYYLSASKLVDELPLISDKKNTFLVILKVLKEKGLLDSDLSQNKSRYKVTEKGKSFLFEVFKGVEKNQDKSGNKSRLGVELIQDNNNTSYNNTRIIKNNNISNDILLQKKEEKIENSFFDLLKNLLSDFDFIEKLKNKFGVENEDLKSSAENFLIYWTEKNQNGKKERREMQKVFDIKKRFYTWISNDKKFIKSKQKTYTDVNFESVDFNNI